MVNILIESLGYRENHRTVESRCFPFVKYCEMQYFNKKCSGYRSGHCLLTMVSFEKKTNNGLRFSKIFWKIFFLKILYWNNDFFGANFWKKIGGFTERTISLSKRIDGKLWIVLRTNEINFFERFKKKRAKHELQKSNPTNIIRSEATRRRMSPFCDNSQLIIE